jgi:hypothetical protein
MIAFPKKKRLLWEPLFSIEKPLAFSGVSADGRHRLHRFRHLSFFLRHSMFLPTAQTRAPRLQLMHRKLLLRRQRDRRHCR